MGGGRRPSRSDAKRPRRVPGDAGELGSGDEPTEKRAHCSRLARPCARGLKPERGAGSAVAAERSAAALDLNRGTVTIEATRVVVNGTVIESDGKTENAQRIIALDPFTLAALSGLVDQLDTERSEFGPEYHDHGLLFCWEDGRPPHPDTITRRFKRLAERAGLSLIDLHDVRPSPLQRPAMPRSIGRPSASGSGCRRGFHDAAICPVRS